MKACNRCHQIKPLSAFHKNKQSPDNHQYACKECQRNYHKDQYKSNFEYREKRKTSCRKNQRKHYCSEKEWVRKLKQKYNLTITQYSKMLVKQNRSCAICKQLEKNKHQNGKIIRLAVNHDHKTGKIRGLLCAECNQNLGRMLKNKFWKKALNYLKGGD